MTRRCLSRRRGGREAAVLLSVFGLIGTMGCSRGRAKFEDLPTPDPAAIYSRVQANQAALKDFDGSGLLEVSNARMGRTFLGVKLLHVNRDYLLLSLNAAMGIQVGSLLLNGEQYEVSYGLPPVHAAGYLRDFAFPENFGFELKGEDILKILLPLELISAPADSARVQKDFQAKQYRLDWSTEGQNHSLWADPYRPVFTRELIVSSSGDTLVLKEFEEFARRAGVHFPASWSIRLGKAEQQSFMRFKLRRLQVNSGLTPQDLQLAPEAPADTVEVEHGG